MKGAQKTSPSIGVESGTEVAIEALAWLAADEGRLERFLALSGLGPQNLRKAAAEPQFLTAILDYLTSNEALLVDFAKNAGRTPEGVARAHAALRGPETEAFP